MPTYTYIAGTSGQTGAGNGVDAKLLRNKYFVQLNPDKQHLVLGMLQQGTRPSSANIWLQAGKINRDFSKRYFVQYTDFNTLVPGSLIQATRFPPGKWKEIKRMVDPLASLFRQVNFTEGYSVNDNVDVQTQFLDTGQFFPDVFYPVLDHYYPGLRDSGPVYCDMYYFKGTYDELGEDVTKLVPFSQPDSFFLITFSFSGDPLFTINTSQLGVDNMFVMPGTEDGSYCFIMATQTIRDSVPADPVNYIVLENVFTKSSPVPS